MHTAGNTEVRLPVAARRLMQVCSRLHIVLTSDVTAGCHQCCKAIAKPSDTCSAAADAHHAGTSTNITESAVQDSESSKAKSACHRLGQHPCIAQGALTGHKLSHAAGADSRTTPGEEASGGLTCREIQEPTHTLASVSSEPDATDVCNDRYVCAAKYLH